VVTFIFIYYQLSHPEGLNLNPIYRLLGSKSFIDLACIRCLLFNKSFLGEGGQDRDMMDKMHPEPILHVKDEDKDRGNSQITY